MLKETTPPSFGSDQPSSDGRPFSSSSLLVQKGDLLFVEGADARGVFLLHNGRIKISTSLSDGKLVILYVAEAGAILGLNAVLGGCEHEATAEAMEEAELEFLRTDEVRALLRSNAAFAFRAADEMARRYRSARTLVCTLAKSDPILVKLARLILSWLADAGGQPRLESKFTHQQIAEMLGTTRETITRAFRHLRECGILTLKGHLLEVHDVCRLRSLAEGCDMTHRLL